MFRRPRGHALIGQNFFTDFLEKHTTILSARYLCALNTFELCAYCMFKKAEMPKRKREDGPGHRQGRHYSKYSRTTQDDVEDHINTGLKALTRALKQAKGFERQRLGKRVTEATKSDDTTTIERLNAEIAALKTLESRADLAQQHLYKVLLRIKSIKESSKLPPFVRLPAKRDDDPATSNVISRVFRSKGVKKVVDETVELVRQKLGSGSDNAMSSAESGANGQDAAFGNGSSRTRREESSPTNESVTSMGRSDESQFEQQEDFGPISQSDDDFAEFDDRIAWSSEESDDDASEDHLEHTTTGRKQTIVYKPSASQSPSPELSLTPSASPSISLSPGPGPVRKAPPSAPTAAFLPTLSMGGYLSGSESEAEDLDALGPPRKNRRGQRARQQIWQKKYGGKAKHLHKDGKDRNAGWDARHGAQLAGEKRKPGQPWKKERQPGIASGPNEIAVKPRKVVKKKTDDLPLHPSWEAKRLAKEKQAQSATFVGKKITFD